MIRIQTVVGARPQFIKAAAVSRRIKAAYSNKIQESIIHTGQHYDDQMSSVFFQQLGIPKPDHHLSIGSASHGQQTGEMLIQLEALMLKERPDAVLVYGDTNSTLAAALAASKNHIPVIHIEAGLRSFNKSMPEEINRIYTDAVSTLLFAPTQTAINNLTNEGIKHASSEPFSIDRPGVFHCGDIMYDNALFFREKAKSGSSILQDNGLLPGQFILGTIHRPVNTDHPDRLQTLFQTLLQLADSTLPVVLPLHPRTQKSLEAHSNSALMERLKASENIRLLPPADYLDMVALEASCALVVTDSGGVQKEAWFMEKPVVILRKETEWVEIVQQGNGVLVDADEQAILEAVNRFLVHPPTNFPEIYGNGQAADEILDIITRHQFSE